MAHSLFLLCLLTVGVLCHPAPPAILIPDVKFSSPEEVNGLTHNHNARSIKSEGYTVNKIEQTVKEVEDIIKSNPALPRLTRGEILDLLENITKTDMDKLNLFGEVRDPKAIMVVMPFTPASGEANNMEDLYTKPPVTHIIGGEPFKKTETTVDNRPIFRRKPSKSTTEIQTQNPTTVRRKPVHRKPTTTTTTTTTEKPKEPTYGKRGHSRRRRPPVTTEASTTTTSTYRSRTRSSIRRAPTPPARYPNHKYPDDNEKPEESIPSDGLRIVNPPKFHNSNEDLHIEEDTKQEVYVKQEVQPVYKAVKKPYYQKTTPIPLVDDFNIPDHLKPVVAAMDLDTAVNDPPKKITPAKPATIDETDKIKTMLASLGVLPPSTTTSFPDMKNVADTLSPEMKDLLMSFGLIPNPNPQVQETKPEPYYPTKAEVNPDSYVGFKPLPEDTPSRNEMEGILASFGLLRNGRKEKSVKHSRKSESPKELNFDMVPDSLKGVLDDIGLTGANRSPKKIRTTPLEKITEKQQHVFNPSDTQYASDEEIDKLNKLLEMIKKLEKLNGTATEEDLKKIDLESLKELVGSLNNNNLIPLDQQKNSPNPLNFDTSFIKNEVKRQESSTTSTTSTTVASSTTTEESRTASVADLEASFGGQAETVSEAEPPETTTSAPRTGFYYLVDWNTFLDIDDQKGKRVNLRFQPTIGDPKRFLSVSVP